MRKKLNNLKAASNLSTNDLKLSKLVDTTSQDTYMVSRRPIKMEVTHLRIRFFLKAVAFPVLSLKLSMKY